MKFLITIAARGGSKGVKNKNIRELAGKPLIHYTIQQALSWGKAEQVVVTTDSEEIAQTARLAGAQVPFLRPREMATDTCSKFPALRHALTEMEKIHATEFDFVMDLDPTCPIRTHSDLDAALEKFQNQKLTTLFSVTLAHKNPYFNLVEIDSKGVPRLSKGKPGSILSRQAAPEAYGINGSIYLFRRSHLLDPQTESSFTENSGVYIMSDLAGIDIDREIDFQFIEFLIEKGIWKP